MANPQTGDGFTPIANEIIEALWRVNLSSYETRVLWYLLRKTYGWQKKTDMIALSQFSKAIGIDRRHIHRAIKALSSKKMIVTYKGDNSVLSYGFQKDYEKWRLSPIQVTVPKEVTVPVPIQVTKLSPIQVPTKEKKEIIKKIYITPHLGQFQNVKLTEAEHKNLVNQFSETGAKERIENLSLYLASKGDKYKNHYATILAWERKNPKTTQDSLFGTCKKCKRPSIELIRQGLCADCVRSSPWT